MSSKPDLTAAPAMPSPLHNTYRHGPERVNPLWVQPWRRSWDGLLLTATT